MEEDNKKPKIIHRNKFMSGRMSPHEAHIRYGIRKNCVKCARPAVIRIKILVTLDELTKRHPEFVAAIAATNPNGPYIPTIPTTYGPMIMISDVGACEFCRKDAEVTAARGAPSWAIVEIDTGIAPNKPQIQVPGSE